jgi:CDP-glucose 4,6-dehydratase
MNTFSRQLTDHFAERSVLITGNTGFKGSWLSHWLLELGANVAGYSDDKLTTPSLYRELSLNERVKQVTGDITDFELLRSTVKKYKPAYIFHLAAQSLVATSLQNPLETFRTNTFGSVTLLEVLRNLKFDGTTVLVTSDKCYENDERIDGYSELDRMGGKDPYSASKGAAELAISAYVRTYFLNSPGPRLGIGRAGNVIGGGDWNDNRIIVDCVRAWEANQPVNLRNPESTRPWQHVLEPLSGYLQLALQLHDGNIKSGEAFNFGPREGQVFTVSEIVNQLASIWPNCPGVESSSKSQIPLGAEAKLLSLNCSKASDQLGWQSTLEISECLTLIAEWYLAFADKLDLREVCSKQISYFQSKYQA